MAPACSSSFRSGPSPAKTSSARSPSAPSAPVRLGQHARELARLERADREHEALGHAAGQRGGRTGAVRGRAARAGQHRQRTLGIQTPFADGRAARGLGDADHALRAPRQPPGSREALPEPVVERVVARAVLEGEVVDGEDERRARRHRHRRGRGSPHHVAPGGEPVEPRAAGQRGRRQPGATGVDELVAVLRKRAPKLVEQAAQVARHAPGARRTGPQCPAVDRDVHAADC